MHMDADDGIYRGFDEELNWGKYRVMCEGELGEFGAVYEIPEISLEELARFFQKKMEMQVVQLVGNPKMAIRRVSVLVGGGSLGLGEENLPMRHMNMQNIDVQSVETLPKDTDLAYVKEIHLA